MGVTGIFCFRRLFRRGRRIVDGNRHLVVGHDKIQLDAKSSPPLFPKGTHFLVTYDRDRLSASEIDICNNNDSDSSSGGGSVFRRNSSVTPAVVFTMLPGGVTQVFQHTSESVAVLPTTELKEVSLFSQQ